MIIPPRAPSEVGAAAEKMRAALIDSLEPSALRTLYTAGRRLGRCESRAEVYDVVVSCAQTLIGGTAAFFAPGHHAGLLDLAAGLRLPDTTPTEISAPLHWLAMLYERGTAVRSDTDAVAQSPLALLSERMAYGGVVVALPVLGATQHHGLLVLAPHAMPSTISQEAALLSLAGDGAQALDRIMQIEGVWHEADVSGSNRVLAAVNAVTDIGLLYSNLLDQMVGAILAQILSVLGLAGGAVLLYNEQSEDLDLAVVLPGPGAGTRGAEVIALWQPALRPHSAAEARNAANHGQVSVAVAEGDPPLAAALQAAGGAADQPAAARRRLADRGAPGGRRG